MKLWDLLCEFASRSLRKTRRNLSTATGVRFRSSLSAGRLRLSACSSCGLGDFHQHYAGLFTSVGVDVVVAEEDLGRGFVRGAVLGHAIRTDVDDSGVGLLWLQPCGVRGLRHWTDLRWHHDHVDTAIVSQCLVQLEFELFVLSQL